MAPISESKMWAMLSWERRSYDVDGKLDGKDAMLIAVYQEFGANALDVAA